MDNYFTRTCDNLKAEGLCGELKDKEIYLVWQNKKPTESGFYWWKIKNNDIPIIIEINASNKDEILYIGGEGIGPVNEIASNGELFYGPLLPPDCY